MEDVLLLLTMFAIFCIYAIGIAVILFKIFFPAVPNVGPIKDKVSLDERQTEVRHTAHFNPKIQYFSFKSLD